MHPFSRKNFETLVTFALLALTFASPSTPRAAEIDLEQGFRNPPNEARPRVWWHWMNGNVTKEGITADLEWMKRVGIGGMQNFDASLGTPQVVETRLAFMTPERKDAFRHAASLARDHDPVSSNARSRPDNVPADCAAASFWALRGLCA